MFNIYINDLTFFIEDSHLCNFADDNTLYSTDIKLEKVISGLENETLLSCQISGTVKALLSPPLY